MSELSVTIHGIWTLVLMITVIGIYAWAWSSKREADFSEAAMLAVDISNNNPEKKEIS
ncbi:MAG: cbb3-type cytochrome c oxidase subunit 3 [Gammaproteobacteria bacterium]|jgi:cytochrome c oxidase cbb3-type subunit 4|nr:cbb3-type cytochrome c oxidase subunit 3 [Gammaproteobacteria bacterium]MBT3723477.1 cbb3-type cytochrome c oxidase subunit 3 [Gammaproteobacteria bacterium]MBT4076609.1 cbb3-type cytochrome c oxidase subunit 3 [Gammaproteobacteria bacterium]MBT4194315.1 cbb3-type cytochrome c oxidase subunit 3 [Gammaproteobacteria bacterium]MBT4450869.1 cbb3-type cytochrome c oxidase subunit 3 [Gammaproteobacteria bacterium]